MCERETFSKTKPLASPYKLNEINNLNNLNVNLHNERKHIPHFNLDADMLHEWEHNSEDADF